MANLFHKNKMRDGKLIRQLLALVAATATSGFGMLPEKDAKEMATAQPTFLSINPTLPADANGMVQAAALQPGIDAATAIAAVAGTVASAPAPTEPAVPIKFEIRTDVPLPVTNRGGGPGRASKYPFAEVPENGSFFIPNGKAKALASTISNANKKFKVADPARKFRVVSDTENGVAGARVFRIAVKPVAPTA
jgi:hypothetical protein